MPNRSILTVICVLVALLVGAPSALAAGSGPPRWMISSVSGPTNFAPGSSGDHYVITATNVGGEATSGTVEIDDTLPKEGVAVTAVSGAYEAPEFASGNGEAFTKGAIACPLPAAPIKCTYAGAVPSGDTLRVTIKVSVTAPEGTPLENTAAVSAGGSAPATAIERKTVTSQEAQFGIANFFTTASTTQAGAHPDFTTSFALTRGSNEPQTGDERPSASPRDIQISLPPGLTGNPLAVPRCNVDYVRRTLCPADTAVGVATVRLTRGDYVVLVYNVVPYPDEPAAFAFQIGGGLATVRLDTSVVPNSHGEYAVHVTVPEINESEPVLDSSVTLWGVPADFNGPGPYRAEERSTAKKFGEFVTFGGPSPEAALAKPFMRNPTGCGDLPAATLEGDSWQASGLFTPVLESGFPPATECGVVSPLFTPSLTVAPDTHRAGAPAGYGVDLELPQSNDAHALATPDLRTAAVTLPLGTVASPSAANGLQACSDTQFGLAGGAGQPAACPQASQIGKVSIKTPLLEGPLEGQVFLGQPECSPCDEVQAGDGRMLRLFLQAEGSGVRIKLAGRTHVDQQTGQLTSVFEDNPQQPFEKLTLRLYGGPAAPLANPAACATATATSQLVPWSSTSAEPFTAEPSSSFQVEGCLPPRFTPSLQAGTTATAQAGSYSPLSVTFARSDEDQQLGGITVRTPPGLLGMVSNVAPCDEVSANAGTCPQASEIGSVTAGVGPGPSPYYVTGGKAYLTGPYGGGPYGLSIVVPAVAGPFNLGQEVVRAAIYVDPRTAALTITSNPLPTKKDGIPFQIKTVNVNVTRPGFMFNATDCSAQSIGATITGIAGATAQVAFPYQAVNCATLPFHPSFTASTQANGNFNGNGASLHVSIVAPGQGPRADPSTRAEANIRKVDVQLPLALPSRLTTLQKACTERQFAANPAGCPAASDVGTAVVHTPVLPAALTGPAYLVSHGGAEFPDLDIILQGNGVVIDLVGNTQIRKGITFSKFDTAPDAPISSFELNLPEGKYSALAAYLPSGTLCAPTKSVTVRKRVARRTHGRTVQVLRSVKQLIPAPLLMPTTITGQNGAELVQNTRIAVTGCPIAKHRVTKAKRQALKPAKGRRK